jgi:hypothetical protein
LQASSHRPAAIRYRSILRGPQKHGEKEAQLNNPTPRGINSKRNKFLIEDGSVLS